MSRILGFTLLAAMALAAPARADMVNFKGTMSGAQEVPATTTNGMGDVLASLDTKTKMLSYTVTYTGLSGPATAAASTPLNHALNTRLRLTPSCAGQDVR